MVIWKSEGTEISSRSRPEFGQDAGLEVVLVGILGRARVRRGGCSQVVLERWYWNVSGRVVTRGASPCLSLEAIFFLHDPGRVYALLARSG